MVEALVQETRMALLAQSFAGHRRYTHEDSNIPRKYSRCILCVCIRAHTLCARAHARWWHDIIFAMLAERRELWWSSACSYTRGSFQKAIVSLANVGYARKRLVILFDDNSSRVTIETRAMVLAISCHLIQITSCELSTADLRSLNLWARQENSGPRDVNA